MDFLKSITGRVVTGLVALLVVAGAISWWRTDPATRELIVGGAGKIAAWLGVVLALPWVSFFAITRVARLESNLAGGVLVAGYTLIEVTLLLWLFDFSIPNAT